MKYFYSYKKNDFIELTHNSVSLHERYDQISALLNKLLDKKESDILAKPTKHENKINWVNNSKELPYRLNQIDNQLRKKVVDEYWELRKSIDQKLNDLKNKKETQEWILI